jgi:myo-inositol 2-dehydrogenase/D-chiro-inositol 1-dehydrogenase
VAHAHVATLKALDDADTVITTMKFPNDVLASIDISRNSSYGYDQRVEVNSMVRRTML